MRHKQQGMLLRILLNRAHGSVNESLLKGLPKEEADKVRALLIGAQDPNPLLTHAQRSLESIHYSWILDRLKTQSESFHQGILACLTQEQKKGLANALQIPVPEKTLSPFLKKFYLHHIFNSFPELNESLPLEYIPDSSMNKLAELTKKQLLRLIDNLAMFDLAHEMRGIVATKTLKMLYGALTPDQQQFLRKCLPLKDKITPSKLNLDRWSKSSKELMLLLHKRGIIRLAYALSGESEDLIWTIAHRLDKGRGTLLIKIAEKEVPLQIKEGMMLQVHTAMKGEP